MRFLALLALVYQQVPDVARLPRFHSPGHSLERLRARPAAHRGIGESGAKLEFDPLADPSRSESARHLRRHLYPLRIPCSHRRKHRHRPCKDRRRRRLRAACLQRRDRLIALYSVHRLLPARRMTGPRPTRPRFPWARGFITPAREEPSIFATLRIPEMAPPVKSHSTG